MVTSVLTTTAAAAAVPLLWILNNQQQQQQQYSTGYSDAASLASEDLFLNTPSIEHADRPR